MTYRTEALHQGLETLFQVLFEALQVNGALKADGT